MNVIAENFYQSKIEHPFGNAVCTAAYFAPKSEGNILFYSSGLIEDHFSFIENKGGIAFQYLNHRDEAGPVCDKVEEKFKAPVVCHELERDAVTKQCRVGAVFAGRSSPFRGFEIIPTPGHCPGSTCFLWKTNGKNILLTGDTLYPNNSRWQVAIPEGQQEQMILSLNELLELQVDAIVPGLFIGQTAYQFFDTKAEYSKIILECIKRLKLGSTH